MITIKRDPAIISPHHNDQHLDTSYHYLSDVSEIGIPIVTLSRKVECQRWIDFLNQFAWMSGECPLPSFFLVLFDKITFFTTFATEYKQKEIWVSIRFHFWLLVFSRDDRYQSLILTIFNCICILSHTCISFPSIYSETLGTGTSVPPLLSQFLQRHHLKFL